MSQLTLNTKKMQLSKHDLLQRKKKRIRRKLKRLNDVALVGSECCCTWPPHSISSRIKTHHIMTDTTAVTIWIPLRSFYNVKKRKNAQVTSLSLNTTKHTYLTNSNCFNRHRGKYGCNVLIFESTRRLLHIPTHQRGHLLPPTVVCIKRVNHTTFTLFMIISHLAEITPRSIKIWF